MSKYLVGIYLMGLIAGLGVAVSYALFEGLTWRQFGLRVFLSVIWPVAMLSPTGLRILSNPEDRK